MQQRSGPDSTQNIRCNPSITQVVDVEANLQPPPLMHPLDTLISSRDLQQIGHTLPSNKVVTPNKCRISHQTWSSSNAQQCSLSVSDSCAAGLYNPNTNVAVKAARKATPPLIATPPAALVAVLFCVAGPATAWPRPITCPDSNL